MDRGTGADNFSGEQIFRDERREITIGVLGNVKSTQNQDGFLPAKPADGLVRRMDWMCDPKNTREP